MKIRTQYSLKDRAKLLVILLILLTIILAIICLVRAERKKIEEVSLGQFLEIAIKPVGSTMYIWGGGWDDEDSQAGTTSTRIGISEQWEDFADQQDENYDFKEHRYERENGLDCSGYVGWVVYNTFEKKDGNPGYVTTSTDMAKKYADRGWGQFIKNPKDFLPGDIVSMEGHVWICLGTCEDDSVLLVHSSPPGVSVCGTPVPKGNKTLQEDEDNGNGKSMAIQLATDFMTTYFPDWQEKYPNRTVSISYLEEVSVFRWSEKVMSDAKEFQKLSGEEIIVYMSPEV